MSIIVKLQIGAEGAQEPWYTLSKTDLAKLPLEKVEELLLSNPEIAIGFCNTNDLLNNLWYTDEPYGGFFKLCVGVPKSISTDGLATFTPNTSYPVQMEFELFYAADIEMIMITDAEEDIDDENNGIIIMELKDFLVALCFITYKCVEFYNISERYNGWSGKFQDKLHAELPFLKAFYASYQIDFNL